MSFRSDPEKHAVLVEELVGVLKERGYSILQADGIQGIPIVRPLPNDGYGDQLPKAPDVYAFDERTQCFIIGEAKTGDGDLETEHALTQYNVFLDQFDKRTGAPAILFMILPATKLPEFNSLITHYIHRDYWSKIVLVSSRNPEL
jgi:hypothetical protein